MERPRSDQPASPAVRTPEGGGPAVFCRGVGGGRSDRPSVARAVFTPALLLLLFVLAAPASPVSAAPPGSPLPGAQTVDGASIRPEKNAAFPDSAELLERARDAQRRFEGVRRRHLPTAFGGGSRSCDDQVGRMCWAHDSGSLWTPEPEAPEVTAAREALLAELAEVAGAIPGDEWVLGQRVWYLVEADRPAEAREVARRCGGPSTWWCAALEGLALHMEARYRAAEHAFDRALAAMDPDRARAWEDVRPLLDGDARSALDDAEERAPAERDALLRRLWSLSDPLLLVPGNERRTEHLARRAVSRVRSEARNPHGISWGDDLAELLVRYGWAVAWERTLPDPGRANDFGSVVGHGHPDSRVYVPRGEVLANPAGAEADDWAPRMEYAPSSYAPRHAPVILPMGSQVSVLHRGDSALVAATWELPADTTYRARQGVRDEHRPPPPFRGRPVEAGLFVAAVDGDTVHAARAEGARRGSLALTVPAGRWWLSVEVLDPGAGRAGRLRRGLEIAHLTPDIARLSDLLLLEEGPAAGSLDEALGRLRANATVVRGGSVVVAWEIWGLGWREERLGYRLSLKREGGGFFRRVGESLGLVDPDRPRTLEWEEEGPEEPGPTFRSVVLDIPGVEPGRYRLRLEVTTPGRTTLVVERPIEVVEAVDALPPHS